MVRGEEERLTILVPVNMGDVAGSTLTNANPLLSNDVVDIHKVVMGGHCQVAPICRGGMHSVHE